MKYKITWSYKNYEALTKTELYEILALRSQVFVVEQTCAYQDVDDKDQKALHIIGRINRQIVAYARCFGPGFYFKEAAIGRVLVKMNYRKNGFAHQLIEYCFEVIMKEFSTHKIKISAQEYLKTFYESHHFKQIGEGYLEDEIPHIAMIKK